MASNEAAKTREVRSHPGSKAIVTQTLRETQPKKFRPSSMQLTGYDYSFLHVTAPADWDIEDVMNPAAWVNVCDRVARNAQTGRGDALGSLIYVHSADHAFLCILHIAKVQYNHLDKPCGLEVVCIGPSVDPKTGKACPIDLRTGLPWAGRPKTDEKAA